MGAIKQRSRRVALEPAVGLLDGKANGIEPWDRDLQIPAEVVQPEPAPYRQHVADRTTAVVERPKWAGPEQRPRVDVHHLEALRCIEQQASNVRTLLGITRGEENAQSVRVLPHTKRICSVGAHPWQGAIGGKKLPELVPPHA